MIACRLDPMEMKKINSGKCAIAYDAGACILQV
jgi:hypothetical protein